MLLWPAPIEWPDCDVRWLHDGSCIRLRPERCNRVWSYDFGRLRPTMAASSG